MGVGPINKTAARWGAAATAVMAAGVLAVTTVSPSSAAALSAGHGNPNPGNPGHGDPGHEQPVRTSTPIKHLVVIFNENVSFDHYFGTYPKAANTDGTPFKAAKGTPKVDGLTKKLLTKNPNQYNPKRLSHEQALTCSQDHGYGHEQLAYDGGKMDQFVEHTEHNTCGGNGIFTQPGIVMDYYDGNTVTAMWNYAQHYAMSDNSYNTGFGPSTPGAINLISGNTHGIVAVDPVTHAKVNDTSVAASPDANGVGTVINDPDPAFDDCSDNNHTSKNNLAMATGRNVGDLLNAKGVNWGWFQGGFRPTGTAGDYSVCGSTHQNIGGNSVVDYSPHHSPFEYYKSTSNPKHLAPSSVAAIGRTDQANHNYDMSDFDAALAAGNLPSVSFLKAPAYQDGHPGNSDPLDEQTFTVNTINKIQKSKFWDDTAIVVAYDDSDGWYDHKKSPIVNGSADPAQDSAALCGKAHEAGGYQDRCGYGPRTPLLVISPYSRVNHVDHTLTDQTSILRFIEDNWGLGRIGDTSFDERAGSLAGLFDFHKAKAGQVILNPASGAVVSVSRH
ncbi:alkaline phosphatase family protein [Microbispora sp. RL4-1S]|uniref:Alkaline phosphatase family protein n=1 Tax=Microbispora oryzae TaxID=2806554 RepID=A0A941AJK9_9ACTN|nr:alkaline phosphatase family protein [Microbispora oryzae]MBP2705102.1 alkaline phosphatase family protein [Microbispora oryzae]